jgi:hypothetical protein
MSLLILRNGRVWRFKRKDYRKFVNLDMTKIHDLSSVAHLNQTEYYKELPCPCGSLYFNMVRKPFTAWCVKCGKFVRFK